MGSRGSDRGGSRGSDRGGSRGSDRGSDRGGLAGEAGGAEPQSPRSSATSSSYRAPVCFSVSVE
ncbi:hypothetical protein DQW50_10035 [Halorubrum sp. 48-1-W]|nr:hypothetical protein DQW50_10035 [Halorubrum sp. 48-1-W]